MKLAVVSGSRAEYGLLKPVLTLCRNDAAIDLQLVVTGMHCAARYGHTERQIEQDGFAIAARLPMLLTDNSACGVASSLGLGVIGMARLWQRLQPEAVLLLGDRYEILAAAQAALIGRIPIVHLSGGDITEGAYDDAIRHSISKMAQLHCVFHEQAASVLRQLGEDPARIVVTGNPGLDALHGQQLLPREQLQQALGINWQDTHILCTFHPETLAPHTPAEQLQPLLQALRQHPAWGVVITRPNADDGSQQMLDALDAFVAEDPYRRSLFTSLGSTYYPSVMQAVDMVLGNSSSGLIETPTLGIPAVDVGGRQQGRLRAANVFHAAANTPAIEQAMQAALQRGRQATINPYGDGHSARRVLAALHQHWPQLCSGVAKPFIRYDA